MPFLINPGNANLDGKITFVFFAPSVLMSIYLYFCFPEMKGRTYLELEEMFQAKLPARQFSKHVCQSNILLEEVMEKHGVTELENVETIKEAVATSGAPVREIGSVGIENTV